MTPATDPRKVRDPADVGAEYRSVMPVIQRSRAGLSGPAIVLCALFAALSLFLILNARRQSLAAPATSARPYDLSVSETLPPLTIPVVASEPILQQPIGPVAIEREPQTVLVQPTPPQPRIVPSPPAIVSPAKPQAVQNFPPAPVSASRNTGGTAIVFDAARGSLPAGNATVLNGETSARGNTGVLGSRARAGIFANRATTIPQGTVIPAVLETSFDSTGPGIARALVQHDVRGFDGSRVLVPRGSRLIGEFQGDVSAGQKRALITWTRLLRPDGATIALASPAADPVGRGGVRAHVNTHFLERFSSALLRSVVNLGTSLAPRSANNSVVVALPGSIQGATSALSNDTQLKPTLSVERGTSVSALVARDLDFTSIETGL